MRIIGDTCFFNHPEIYSIQFPRLLTAIGNASFALCSRIKELVIPDSVVSIGVHAFRDCKGLKRVVMPKHLKVLSAGIFAFCYLSDDVQMTLPEDLEEIEPHAFYSGGTFKLVVPKNVKKIGVGAFNWGPKVITSLPFDKGWYLDWPYGEKILLSDGQVGIISDIKEITNGCEILDVNVDRLERIHSILDKVNFQKFCAIAALFGVSKEALAIRLQKKGMLGNYIFAGYESLLDVFPTSEETAA
ncbi:MAG: leucine-rich repeat domain-containing protein [Ruminococcus sp.]|nr:leucine-rich repeat domain-containing protein [Ruminococcus sp.]